MNVSRAWKLRIATVATSNYPAVEAMSKAALSASRCITHGALSAGVRVDASVER